MANLNEIIARNPRQEIDIAWNEPLNVVQNENELLELLARNQEIFALANDEIRTLNGRVRQLENAYQEQDDIIENGIQTVQNLQGRVANLEDELLERAHDINNLMGQIVAAQNELNANIERNNEEIQQLNAHIQDLQNEHADAVERMSQVMLSIIGREMNASTREELDERIRNIANIIGQDRATQLRDAVAVSFAASEHQRAEQVRQNQDLEGVRNQVTELGERFEYFIRENTRVLVEEATRDSNKLSDVLTFLRMVKDEFVRQRNAQELIRTVFHNMDRELYKGELYEGWGSCCAQHSVQMPNSFEQSKEKLNTKISELINLIHQIEERYTSITQNIQEDDQFNGMQCVIDLDHSRELVRNVNRDQERTFQQEYLSLLNTNLEDAASYVSWLNIATRSVLAGISAFTFIGIFFVTEPMVNDMNNYGKRLDYLKDLINNEIANVSRFITTINNTQI